MTSLRHGLVALAVLALTSLSTTALGVAAGSAAHAATAGVQTEDAQVPVGAEPDGTAVSLDTTTFVPDGGGSHPAILLTHGFGGTKDDVVGQARRFAERGFVVLTYTARGFGSSGGMIHLADPAYEGADSEVLLDRLAARSDVARDDGSSSVDADPRVGVVGASYGGALALMAGATDPRVDTVVAAITWNDLADAFFPQNALAETPPATDSPADVPRADEPGPFKQLWASQFFLGSSLAGASTDPVCGRFDPTVCRLFLAAAQTGTPSEALLELMREHSPAPLLDGLTAPTYLVQGMADTLFGLEQADTTARTLITQGTPVAVRWMDGGHDGVSTTADADEASVETWLEHYLPAGADQPADPADLPVPAFAWAEPPATGADSASLEQSDDYAGAATYDDVAVSGAAQPVLNPPGGAPGSLTRVPTSSGVSANAFDVAVSTYPLAALPGQSAAFDTAPLERGRTIVGSPRVRLTVTSTATSSTLFLSLWELTGSQATLTRQLVAPVTVTTTPGQPTEVEVALPAASYRLASGSALRVLVTSTDQTYAGPRTARADQVQVSDLRLPDVAGTALAADGGGGQRDTETIGVLVAIGVLALALLGTTVLRRRRRRQVPVRDDLADVPLVVSQLVKTYADGHRAVDDVSWRAERGQVVGLLGPNGAGKTTTLRMVMGLIRPDSGTAHVLGQQVAAGSPVLARVGALVEGPGFLPHLTGRQNLEAYWAATGRDPAEADYETVLDVAALGGAVDRPVRTYSQGMRQRLGIAQAMLGLPEVLVLDEPTNGLDPPQIAGLRPILHRYAAAGRTVVVSSHLLSEVELTCSHVVVMHAGRVVTTGTVAELVDSADTTVVRLTDPDVLVDAAASLRRVDGITAVEADTDPTEPRLVVTADLSRADVVRAVVASGADVESVSSRRQLEEVFLGVIAAASAGPDDGADGDGGGPAGGPDTRSVSERLRQVRSR